MAVAVAAAVLLASIILTYVCCVRPMRQGRCAVPGSPEHSARGEAVREEELARLRAEVAELRAGEEHSARGPDRGPLNPGN
ncbi:MAG: hypothetical protein ACRDUV_13405 [Pseudonocardiaceae bacterium]